MISHFQLSYIIYLEKITFILSQNGNGCKNSISPPNTPKRDNNLNFIGEQLYLEKSID